MKNRAFALLLAIGILGCSKTEVDKPIFSLLDAEQTGVTFSNNLTSTPEFNILEYLYFYNGGGVAAGDINNDGLIDLYFSSNQESNRLYLNKGGLKFQDITEEAGVMGSGTWSTGVTMADINADGYLDIYVCQVGNYKLAQGSNQLFINNQDGTFTELASAYGLDFSGFSTHAAFFDYDRDGDLDMYLLNHSVKNPEIFTDASVRSKPDEGGDRLFQNQAAQGNTGFIDVTEEAGIYSSIVGFGLGVAISDINADGWPDIYVSNDFTENDYLYINNQNGTFSEQLEDRIQHTSRFSMGNEIADLNNDGLGEIITTDMLPSDPEIWKKSVVEDKSEVYKIKLNYGYGHQYVRNTLQRNLGNGQFSDLSLFANTYASDWSWSPLIFDMDNDGLQDLHITNGIYKRPNDLDYLNYQSGSENFQQKSQDELEVFLIETLPTVKISNYAGQNQGNFRIADVSKSWGLDQPSYSNGSTYADLDNDGDLELITNNIAQEAFIYENQSDSVNGFLKVNLKGSSLNPFGIGSKVEVRLGNGLLTRENYTSRGFQSSTSPQLVFGLGTNQTIDELKVIWPDGKEQRLKNVPANQTITVNHNDAVKPGLNLGLGNSTLLKITPLPFSYVHTEDDFSDFDREYLIPRKFSTEGPALAIADVNSDGLDDIYFGGAKDQAGELWIQQSGGSFTSRVSPVFDQLAKAEDVAADFFDADGDGDQDLYVASGGNEFQEGQLFSYDRLYLNDGQGNFRFSPPSLPQIGSQGKTIAIQDIDKDGDMDIFVGSNIVSGAYGINPRQYLLINNGRGIFQDETSQRIPGSEHMGMINASEWLDFDQDGDEDLLVAGEWTGIRLYENDGQGRFSEATPEVFDESRGWWYNLEVADLNNDGKPDIVAGNLGLNSKLRASKNKPVTLYASDLDKNGQVDPIVFHYLQQIESPFATRDDLIKQVSAFKKLHPDYKTYSKIKSPEELLGRGYEEFYSKQAFTFKSMVFINQGNGKFNSTELPQAAQYAPIMDMVIEDIDGDGVLDLVIFGNNYTYRNDYGRADAKPITLLLGKGDGRFTAVDDSYVNTAGTWGEYRKAGVLDHNNARVILAVRNNDTPVLLQIK